MQSAEVRVPSSTQDFIVPVHSNRNSGLLEEGALRVVVLTWNLGNAPVEDFRPLISGKEARRADLFAFGFQEKSARTHKNTGNDSDVQLPDTDVDNDDDDVGEEKDLEESEEASAQEKVSAIRTLRTRSVERRSIHDVHEDVDDFSALAGTSSPLQNAVEAALGSGFRLVGTVSRGSMQLLVYVRYELWEHIHSVEQVAENTGFFKVLPNKGGMCLRMVIDDMPLAFVSCHLTAHEGQAKCERRNESCAEILRGARAGDRSLDILAQTHHVFWFGDMNYRTDFGLSKEENREKAFQLVELQDWKGLADGDELMRELGNRRMLVGFKACPTPFPPTFKRLRGQIDGFNPKRTPSYTDRILHYCYPGFKNNIRCVEIDSFDECVSSDHKPVRAVFHLTASHVPRINTQWTQQWPVLVFSSLSARNLAAMDIGGTSDPYIKFTCDPPNLLALSNKQRSIKTEVIRNTLNPQWKDIIKIKLKVMGVEALEGAHLQLAVWDKDLTSKNDLIGWTLLSCKEIYRVCATTSVYTFSQEITNNGVVTGILEGRVHIADRPSRSMSHHAEGRCLVS